LSAISSKSWGMPRSDACVCCRGLPRSDASSTSGPEHLAAALGIAEVRQRIAAARK
jgi:hypothetical protein